MEVLTKVIILKIVLFLFLPLNTVYGQEVNWSYEGRTGPENWGALDESFSLCSEGDKQSPVNVQNLNLFNNLLGADKYQYKESTYQVKKENYSIKAEPINGSNYIDYKSQRYLLKQIHFHHPSEHKIKDKRFPMEVHLVHKNENDDLLVIGVLIQIGKENENLKPFFNSVSKLDQKSVTKITFNVEDFIPVMGTYMEYKGSLTTPPCTEGVSWLLFYDPLKVSKTQLETISNLNPENNRPIQREL